MKNLSDILKEIERKIDERLLETKQSIMNDIAESLKVTEEIIESRGIRELKELLNANSLDDNLVCEMGGQTYLSLEGMKLRAELKAKTDSKNLTENKNPFVIKDDFSVDTIETLTHFDTLVEDRREELERDKALDEFLKPLDTIALPYIKIESEVCDNAEDGVEDNAEEKALSKFLLSVNIDYYLDEDRVGLIKVLSKYRVSMSDRNLELIDILIDKLDKLDKIENEKKLKTEPKIEDKEVPQTEVKTREIKEFPNIGKRGVHVDDIARKNFFDTLKSYNPVESNTTVKTSVIRSTYSKNVVKYLNRKASNLVKEVAGANNNNTLENPKHKKSYIELLESVGKIMRDAQERFDRLVHVREEDKVEEVKAKEDNRSKLEIALEVIKDVWGSDEMWETPNELFYDYEAIKQGLTNRLGEEDMLKVQKEILTSIARGNIKENFEILTPEDWWVLDKVYSKLRSLEIEEKKKRV